MYLCKVSHVLSRRRLKIDKIHHNTIKGAVLVDNPTENIEYNRPCYRGTDHLEGICTKTLAYKMCNPATYEYACKTKKLQEKMMNSKL